MSARGPRRTKASRAKAKPAGPPSDIATPHPGLIVELGARGQIGRDESGRWESAVFVALCLIAALPVLAMAPWLSDSFELPKAVTLWLCSAFLLIAMTGLFLWRGNALSGGHRPQGRYLEWSLLGFIAITGILATAFSVDPSVSLFGQYGRHNGLITLLCGLLAAVAALQVEWRSRRLRIITTVLVSAIVVTALYGVAQSFGIDPFFRAGAFTAGRAGGSFGNPSLASGIAAFSVPLALGLLGRLWTKGAAERFLGVLVLILIVAFLVLTLSRGAWIAGVLGSSVWLVLALRSRTVDRRAILAAVLVSAVVVIGVTAVNISRGAVGLNLVERAASALDTQEGSVAIRLETWRTALEAVSERPVLGWGPDVFGLVSIGRESKRLTRLIGDVVEDNAHSYPLQLALDQGVPAAAALLGLMALVMFRTGSSLRRLRQAPKGTDQGELRAVADALLRRRADVRGDVDDDEEVYQDDDLLEKQVGLALALGDVPSELHERTAHLVTYFSAAIAYFAAVLTTVNPVGSAALLWLSIGIVAALAAAPSTEERLRLPLGARIPQQARVGIVVLSAIPLLGLLVLSALNMAADAAFNRGAAAEARSSMTEARVAYADAVRLAPWEGRYARSYGRALIIAGLQISDERMTAEAMRVFEAERITHPADLTNHLFAAQGYLALGQARQDPEMLRMAAERLEESLTIRPNSLEVRDLLATAYYDLDREDDARRVALESNALRPNPRAYYHLGRLAQSDGDTERAAGHYRKALRMDPTADDVAEALEALSRNRR